jgi:integrase
MEPKVHFYLDRAISEKKINALSPELKKEVEKILKNTPRQIWVHLSFLKNERLKVYTGERIAQAFWNSGKERVDPNKYKFGAHDFNKWLSGIEEKILTEVRTRYRFQKTEEATKENIQNLIKLIIEESRERQTNANAPTVLNLLEQYYDKNKKDWSEGFCEIVSATLEHLKSFETWKKKPLSFKDDYSEQWSLFKDYLISLKFNNSTGNKYLKILRRLLKHLASIKMIQLVENDLRLFKELESFRIALKEAEIETLAAKEFKVPHLLRARDLMITQLFTGQRVGDLPQVLEQIKNGGDIHITQGKTKARVTIPKYPLLEKHLINIALRHPEGLHAMTEQKYNEYIKECCKQAKIDRTHVFVELKGDKEIQVTKARFDLVSSHTCRRTFATLANKKGISHKAIMAITGHTSQKTFLEYIRIDDEDVNQEFNEKMK